jgi:hypothetical protein
MSMVKVAKKYGLSDRGLAKICARLDIPVPARGYWARKEAGQEVSPDSLPPVKEGQKNYLYYHPITLQPADPKKQEQEECEKRPENRISVPDASRELHSLAASVSTALEKAKADESGILASEEEWCTAIRVSKGTRDRAIRILNALFGAFDARGYKTIYDKEAKRGFVEIHGVPSENGF